MSWAWEVLAMIHRGSLGRGSLQIVCPKVGAWGYDEGMADEDIHRTLVSLLMRHERQLFAYIYTLVPNRHDAEDILQETSLTIYDKFHEFQQGTDFLSWAMRIAWWKVRAARQKYARSKVLFNDEVLQLISETSIQMSQEISPMQHALTHCLGKLNERDRQFILTRYERDSGVERAAKSSGRSMQAAYKALMRLKQLLHDCVLNELSKEEELA